MKLKYTNLLMSYSSLIGFEEANFSRSVSWNSVSSIHLSGCPEDYSVQKSEKNFRL